MYKVFFTDDEASMRAGIRNGVEWNESGFTLSGEAPDGELALSLMQEIMPDILITDVRMPFMDGIELSRRAKKAMPWIKIIILSGHDEFDYAKQAITIGVEEYLLKPVTSEKLMEALKKVAATISAEREKSRNIEKLMEDSRQIQIEQLLSGLLYNGIEIDSALLLAKNLGISINSDYYLVVIIELRVISTEDYSFFKKAYAYAHAVLTEWENAISCGQGQDRILCVLMGRDEDSLIEEAYALAQAVKYEVERDSFCSVSIAIGSVVANLSELSKALADADMVRRCLSLSNRRQIISIQDIKNGGMMPLADIKKLPAPEKLRYTLKSEISQFLDDYFSNFDKASLSSFMFLNYIFMDILMAASMIVEDLGGDAKTVLSEYSDVSGVLSSNPNAEELKSILSSILAATIDFRDSLAESKNNDVINKAKKYIHDNFTQQSISLHSVAKEVNISPNHFSTIFSQETGETFISYVTRIRLEYAMSLLKTTGMRTSDIGCMAGYNDSHYFNYVFKKNIGMTPKEYRKSL